MAGEESFPNFDWLKQGTPGESGKPKSTPPSGPSFPAPPPAAESEELESPGRETESLLEDEADLPPLIPNSSDGLTLILRNPEEFSEPVDEIAAEAFDVPPPEEVTQGEESPVVEEDQSGPTENPTAEENVPFEEESIPADEESSVAPGGQPVPFERDTDAVGPGKRTTEYPVGFSDAPDFASGLIGIPAAAAAVAAISRPPRVDSDPPANSEPSRPGTTKSSASTAGSTAGGGNKRLVILATYALAVTLAFLLLLIKELNETFRPHHLESLPDIPAEKIENLSYVPANMKLPAGHSVPLGEHRRFGNILVEPLRITREPVQFVHYSGDAKRTKAESGPTWKLWVKLTNVSETQTIAPFDRQLILRWVPKAKQKWDYSNQYITYQGADSRSAPMVQLYRLPPQGDWDLKDQELGKALKPGESYVTYLASSDEGLDEMGDKLVWRVQFRKGYSRKGHGVTTIFEVPFLKEEVES